MGLKQGVRGVRVVAGKAEGDPAPGGMPSQPEPGEPSSATWPAWQGATSGQCDHDTWPNHYSIQTDTHTTIVWRTQTLAAQLSLRTYERKEHDRRSRKHATRAVRVEVSRHVAGLGLREAHAQHEDDAGKIKDRYHCRGRQRSRVSSRHSFGALRFASAACMLQPLCCRLVLPPWRPSTHPC